MRHHVRSGGAPLRRNPMSEILYVVIPPARNPSFSQRKKPLYQVHSGFFHILCFFGVASSKAKPAPPGNAPLRSVAPRQVRRSPRRPAAPRKSGNAPRRPAAPSSGPLTPAEPTRLAAPRPRGEARTACASRAYIGRLGMCTVKVVPSPGMLST